MIIGIVGKAGSGKDTIGKMIQYYIASKERVLCSKENFLKNFFGCYYSNIEESDFQIVKFSYKLKQICCLITGCSMNQLEDEDFKKFPLPPFLQNNSEERTYRWLLQKLGTEVGRQIDPDIWINSLMNHYDSTKKWVITDVRFKNEALSIQLRKGVIIKVIRDSEQEMNHVSETELDSIIPNFTIHNNDSIDELYEKVKSCISNMSGLLKA